MTGIAQAFFMGYGQGGEWTPASLFSSGEQGAWYDPSDGDTLYTFVNNDGGGLPVSVDGAVGVFLDKSAGLAEGSELCPDPTFASSSGWTLGASWAITGGQLVRTAGIGADNAYFDPVLVLGAVYRVSFDATVSAGSIRISLGGSNVYTYTTSGTKNLVLVCTGSTNTRFIFSQGGSAAAGTIDNLSVKRISGNHAYRESPTQQPSLRQDLSANYYIDFDGVDDALTCKNPDLGTSATIAYGLTAGASITGSQTIGANYSYSIDNTYGLILLDRALTGAESTNLTTYLDTKAGA